MGLFWYTGGDGGLGLVEGEGVGAGHQGFGQSHLKLYQYGLYWSGDVAGT